MVKREIVLETIKKMLDSGLDDETISSTLKEIGLNQNEISKYFEEVKNSSAEEGSIIEEDAEAKETELEHSEEIASKTAEKVKEHLNERHEEIETQHATTQAALTEHAEAINAVHEKVSDLHDKIDRFSGGTSSQELLNKIVELNTRMANLEKQLSELKATDLAIKSLLEKIFDANRSILNELERR